MFVCLSMIFCFLLISIFWYYCATFRLGAKNLLVDTGKINIHVMYFFFLLTFLSTWWLNILSSTHSVILCLSLIFCFLQISVFHVSFNFKKLCYLWILYSCFHFSVELIIFINKIWNFKITFLLGKSSLGYWKLYRSFCGSGCLALPKALNNSKQQNINNIELYLWMAQESMYRLYLPSIIIFSFI